MNASAKLIRNARSLSYAIFATKSNERRRWWTDSDGDARISHRAVKRREYDTWISKAAEEDMSFLYGEAPYFTLLSTTVHVLAMKRRYKRPELITSASVVEIAFRYRFGVSTRVRSISFAADFFHNGGDGSGVLWVHDVIHSS